MRARKEYRISIKDLGYNTALIFINRKNPDDVFQWEFNDYPNEIIGQFFEITKAMIIYHQPVYYKSSLSSFEMVIRPIMGDEIEFFSASPPSNTQFEHNGKMKSMEIIIQDSRESVIVTFSDFIKSLKEYYNWLIHSSSSNRMNKTVKKILDNLEIQYAELLTFINQYSKYEKRALTKEMEIRFKDFLYTK